MHDLDERRPKSLLRGITGGLAIATVVVVISWNLVATGEASANPVGFALWGVCATLLSLGIFDSLPDRLALVVGACAAAAAIAMLFGGAAGTPWAWLAVPLLLAATGQIVAAVRGQRAGASRRARQAR